MCKKLGYKGFSELKAEIKLQNDKENTYYANISPCIMKTYEIIDMEVIDKVAKKINKAKGVIFYGVGDSIPFCEMITKNLKCVGKDAQFFIYRHDMVYSAKNINDKYIAFIISTSGETKQLIEVSNILKKKDVLLISLTHLSENTISKLADINLYCWAPKKELNDYNVTDRTGLMIILRVLSEYYWKYYC